MGRVRTDCKDMVRIGQPHHEPKVVLHLTGHFAQVRRPENVLRYLEQRRLRPPKRHPSVEPGELPDNARMHSNLVSPAEQK